MATKGRGRGKKAESTTTPLTETNTNEDPTGLCSINMPVMQIIYNRLHEFN